TAWTESSELFPRATRFICGINSCENPRSYTRTNLTGGTLYEIEVRAKNANGWSGWSHTRTARPND
ncbi:MAG: hypothetical protein OXT51_07840, partial [Chloroflexota bacterium]|nr:hypothetical protein [Chloroflexota bacterium]